MTISQHSYLAQKPFYTIRCKTSGLSRLTLSTLFYFWITSLSLSILYFVFLQQPLPHLIKSCIVCPFYYFLELFSYTPHGSNYLQEYPSCPSCLPWMFRVPVIPSCFPCILRNLISNTFILLLSVIVYVSFSCIKVSVIPIFPTNVVFKASNIFPTLPIPSFIYRTCLPLSSVIVSLQVTLNLEKAVLDITLKNKNTNEWSRNQTREMEMGRIYGQNKYE